MSDKIKIRYGNLADLPILDSREPGIATDTLEYFVGTPKGNISFPKRTLADIALYVSTTGNDSNDGLTSGTALRNMQTAINRIPQIVNHVVNIYVAAGTYAENIVLSGFSGKGSINLNGDTAVSGSYNVTSINIDNCRLKVLITGFRSTTTSSFPFSAALSKWVVFNYCSSLAVYYYCFFVEAATVTIQNCLISNKTGPAIHAQQGAIVTSDTNSGTGNAVGLEAQTTATIGKSSTQPSATTPESTNSGGEIR